MLAFHKQRFQSLGTKTRKAGSKISRFFPSLPKTESPRSLPFFNRFPGSRGGSFPPRAEAKVDPAKTRPLISFFGKSVPGWAGSELQPSLRGSRAETKEEDPSPGASAEEWEARENRWTDRLGSPGEQRAGIVGRPWLRRWLGSSRRTTAGKKRERGEGTSVPGCSWSWERLQGLPGAGHGRRAKQFHGSGISAGKRCSLLVSRSGALREERSGILVAFQILPPAWPCWGFSVLGVP